MRAVDMSRSTSRRRPLEGVTFHMVPKPRSALLLAGLCRKRGIYPSRA
jgi:hypothetical protein